jgi:hypothetical protein
MVADGLSRWRKVAGGRPPPATQELRTAWPGAAGDAIARHSVPVRRSRAGVVTIACADANWAQELAARGEQLATALRRACPGTQIIGLRFVVGDHVLGPPPAGPSRTARRRPSPAARAAAEEATRDVRDERLRALLRRAAAAAMSRPSRD